MVATHEKMFGFVETGGVDGGREFLESGGEIWRTGNFVVKQEMDVPIPGSLLIEPLGEWQNVVEMGTQRWEEFVRIEYSLRVALFQLGVEQVSMGTEESQGKPLKGWVFCWGEEMGNWGGKSQFIDSLKEFARVKVARDSDWAVEQVERVVEMWKGLKDKLIEG